jgi:hypothetical protein
MTMMYFHSCVSSRDFCDCFFLVTPPQPWWFPYMHADLYSKTKEDSSVDLQNSLPLQSHPLQHYSLNSIASLAITNFQLYLLNLVTLLGFV